MFLSNKYSNYNSLIIRYATLRKLEIDDFSSQTLIHLAVGIQPIVDPTPLFFIQHNLEELRSIFSRTNALSNYLDRVDEIGKDGVMHGA